MIALVTAAVSSAAAVLVARPGAGGSLTRRRLRRLTRPEAPRRDAREPARAPAGASLTVPMLLDLVAGVIASGAAPRRALAAVGECLERVHDPMGVELLRLAGRLGEAPTQPVTRAPASGAAASQQGADVLAAALALSASTGAGPVAVIRAAAEEHRRRAEAEQVRAAHRLGVLVLLPTGLALLPAFVLLTVVPLVIDLVLG